MAIVVAIVLIALAFDYINGFHDAANSIATIVSTRVLTPKRAVAWAAFFNFIAFVIFPLHVANTVGKGIIEPRIIDDAVLVGALGGAVAWNLITWWYGLPSSSSHALVGGLLGAGISKGGLAVVQTAGVLKIAIFIIVSPVIGFVLGGAMDGARRLGLPARPPGPHRSVVPAAAVPVGGDVQPGPRRQRRAEDHGHHPRPLIAKGYVSATSEVPVWVVLASQTAMGLGTLSGGWRIVKTMGMRLTKLKPFGGFCAETGAAGMLFLASALGIPVSTTHTITGGIVGVGFVNNPNGVRWAVALRIVWAWLFTIQSAAIIAAIVYFVSKRLGL